MTKQEYLEALIERLVIAGRLSLAAVDKAVQKGMMAPGKAAAVKAKKPPAGPKK